MGKNSQPPPDYQGAMARMGPAIDFKNDFGQMQDGSAAANQAYQHQTSRMDPQWERREEGMRTQLLNQGLDPGSEAYRNAMTDLGQQRNDAYSGARTDAFNMGRGLFQDNMMARQQAISEALRRRMQPLQELGMQQGLWTNQGEIEASLNPLNGIGDILGAGLDVAGMFGLGIPGQGSLAKGVVGGGKK